MQDRRWTVISLSSKNPQLLQTYSWKRCGSGGLCIEYHEQIIDMSSRKLGSPIDISFRNVIRREPNSLERLIGGPDTTGISMIEVHDLLHRG